MPVYFYWGEDQFRLEQAVKDLRQRVVDPLWESFNFEKFAGEDAEAVQAALAQVMTPPFGEGDRLVWLVNTTLGQRCSAELLADLELTLPQVPPNCHLLLTSSQKPDSRSKAVKLLQQHGTIQEFSPIAAWKTPEIEQQIREAAQRYPVRLPPEGIQLLAEAVGNDSRQLHNELEKLALFAGDRPLTAEDITTLVHATQQSSLTLASTLLRGDTATALSQLEDLLLQNEPPLRLLATLTKQFRTWLWVKLLSHERDNQRIAKLAEVGNPKRVYFLQKEVNAVALPALQACLQILLTTEYQLKLGAEPVATLRQGMIQLSLACSRRSWGDRSGGGEN
ncbi:DNA polymerase III subunit delta [Thermosynechococcus sp. B1]|uniref:DNA polymerase III subunit delta n=1 Tax=Thermosynechococcus sp. B1 TaxID=2937792 RepID=UPI002574E7B5|nr:DNA polymerase III subunit delta [Thermosynechococcus sp. B1]WJI26071.1 DNA polymerase III subunit delta [Thermosynechococcus sp. B1]